MPHFLRLISVKRARKPLLMLRRDLSLRDVVFNRFPFSNLQKLGSTSHWGNFSRFGGFAPSHAGWLLLVKRNEERLLLTIKNFGNDAGDQWSLRWRYFYNTLPAEDFEKSSVGHRFPEILKLRNTADHNLRHQTSAVPQSNKFLFDYLLR